MILKISKLFVFILLLSANVFAATEALQPWQEVAAKMAKLSIHDNTFADKMWKETPLHRAAKTGDTDAIYLMVVMQKSDINARDAWGRTPLHYAGCILHQRPAAFDELIRLGADRYALDKDGKLAWPKRQMLWAAKAGDLAVMKKLYELGVDVDVATSYLEYTCGSGEPANHLLHLLVASRNHAALRWACWIMQQQGKSVDVDNELFGSNATPLHHAAYFNDGTAFDILVEFGADKNKSNSRGALWADFHQLGLKERGQSVHSVGSGEGDSCLIL
ncbi:ankyrin repeat domain-containing protein [Candidatus Babeliales bacterium]|nr:ankyrin repeat domain-containing protein [Candidatus Babeliales bacterium]